MSSDNNDIQKKNLHNNITCALCGRIAKNNRSIEETIDGDRYLFDSQNCLSIFKKLANLYGQEFKSISVGEQYNYDSDLKRYVPREQELDTFGKNVEKMENQAFQII